MAEPPPLRPGGPLRPHDHAVLLYATEQDLVNALHQFLHDGIQTNALMAFIHAHPHDDDAWALLERAHPQARRLGKERHLLTDHHTHAFERHGRIDIAQADHAIAHLTRLAEETRRTGLRLFVDASHTYLTRGEADAWFAFEQRLGTRLQAAIGLICAYHRDDVLNPDVMPRVLRTHAYRYDTTHEHERA